MTTKCVGYGLLHKKSKKIVGYETRSNSGGDCCCETQFILSANSKLMWIVEDELNAAFVRMFSTEWYNAGHDTPTNPYNPEELQVIKIRIETSHVLIPQLPNREEYIKRRYDNPKSKHYDPKWAKYRLEDKFADPDERKAPYTLYDLYEFMKEGL
jgi:hypothetical protein